MEPVVAAVVCAVLAAVGGALVPRLVARVPEPGPDPDRPEEHKELYTEVAALPGLALRSAAVCAVGGALFGAVVGWDWPLLWLVPLLPLGVALAVIDWRTMRLPKWLLVPTYPALVVLVLVAGVLGRDWDDLRRAGLGWLVMGGFYLATNLISPRLVAYGDVRLAGVLGIALGYLGWGQLLVGMYVAFLMSALWAIGLAAAKRDRRVLRMRLPFGPAMLAGAALGVVVGGAVARYYLRSIGYDA